MIQQIHHKIFQLKKKKKRIHQEDYQYCEKMQFPDKLSLVWEIFKGEITILKQMVSILRINRFYLGIKERNKQTKSAMLLKIGQ